MTPQLPAAPAAQELTPRTRAWLWTACAVALVLIYLVLWALYSMTHLSSFTRYDQLPAGASARVLGADFRLVSLVRTEELMAAEGGEPQIASADAIWVVATLEVVQRVQEPDFVCATELLGPDQRVWEPGTSDVSRAAPQFCRADELRLGEPFRFEQIFEVPVSYAGGLAGVVIRNHADDRPQQVLVPA